MAQAYRRFGSRVTIIEAGPQIVGREDRDIADEMQRLLADEHIAFLIEAEPLNVQGRSGEEVSVSVRTASGAHKIEGSHLLGRCGAGPKYRRHWPRKSGRRAGWSRLHSRQ